MELSEYVRVSSLIVNRRIDVIYLKLDYGLYLLNAAFFKFYELIILRDTSRSLSHLHKISRACSEIVDEQKKTNKWNI